MWVLLMKYDQFSQRGESVAFCDIKFAFIVFLDVIMLHCSVALTMNEKQHIFNIQPYSLNISHLYSSSILRGIHHEELSSLNFVLRTRKIRRENGKCGILTVTNSSLNVLPSTIKQWKDQFNPAQYTQVFESWVWITIASITRFGTFPRETIPYKSQPAAVARCTALYRGWIMKTGDAVIVSVICHMPSWKPENNILTQAISWSHNSEAETKINASVKLDSAALSPSTVDDSTSNYAENSRRRREDKSICYWACALDKMWHRNPSVAFFIMSDRSAPTRTSAARLSELHSKLIIFGFSIKFWKFRQTGDIRGYGHLRKWAWHSRKHAPHRKCFLLWVCHLAFCATPYALHTVTVGYWSKTGCFQFSRLFSTYHNLVPTGLLDSI